jgi:CubicO group peptidase (beta-lactamase class C family)
MIKRAITVQAVLLLLSGLISVSLFGQSAELANLIQEETQNLPAGTEMSIAILDNGEWAKFGYKLENNALVEVENDHKIFEIGSITKTFTASLVMKLVDEGKVKLADPIQAHLPVEIGSDSFQQHTITIQHLITHTSGLSPGPSSFTMPYLRALIFTPKNPNRNFRARHYYRYLKKFELEYVPGQQWEYNNAGYGLLGEIIHAANGLSWEASVQKYIFTPLGMENSYFAIDQYNQDAFVDGITAKGKKSKPWEMRFINPAGAIKSTLNDMIMYTSAHLASSGDFEFLKGTQNTLDAQIKMPEDKLWKGNSMGLGWWYNFEEEQQPFLWHGGSSGGYTSFVGFSESREQAVVILSNISSSHPSARAENRIPIPILLGQKILRMQG